MKNEQEPEVKAEVDELSAEVATVEGEPELDTAEVEEEIVAEATEEPEAVEAEAVALTDAKQEGKKFLDKFGEIGAVWFVEGLSFEDARDKYEAKLRERIEELESKLAAVPQGEDQPATFSEAQPPKKKRPLVRIAGRHYDE